MIKERPEQTQETSTKARRESKGVRGEEPHRKKKPNKKKRRRGRRGKSRKGERVKPQGMTPSRILEPSFFRRDEEPSGSHS
jgi:hypothetical protein